MILNWKLQLITLIVFQFCNLFFLETFKQKQKNNNK